jgi:hypothetical protein
MTSSGTNNQDPNSKHDASPKSKDEGAQTPRCDHIPVSVTHPPPITASEPSRRAISEMNPTMKLAGGLFALLTLGGASPAQSASLLSPRGSSLDPSSYSNVEQFAPSHMSFELAVDFNRSSVIGNATHTLTSLEDTATIVFMDVRDGLTVNTSEFWTDAGGDCPANWTNVLFNISTPNPNIGNALDIILPCTVPVNTTFFLRFSYETIPGNSALDWLTPAQTAGKDLPYVYSLCQMNYCRDFAPMMDSPSQKITYDATVVVPNEFLYA